MIDWAKVNELRDEVGAEDFAEVVELFLEEVEARLENLGLPDTSLEHDLHFLKGSALNLGFADFGALCAQGETAAAQGQDDTVDIEKIKSVYGASRALFLPKMNADMAS